MTDLRDRFGELDRIVVPDLEDELRRPRIQTHPVSPTRRLAAAGLALLVALAGFVLTTTAFLGDPPVERKTPPAPILGNGRIAVAQGPDQDIVLIDPDGSGPSSLVDRHGAGESNNLEMAWSPDGSMLAYTDVRDDGLDGLFVLHLVTGDVLDLSEGLTSAAKPAWSPDGSRIAFTGADGASGYEIYVVGSDGTGRVPITAEADNGVDGAHMPAWSPDGSRIAFAVDRYDETTETEDHGIVVVDASGGNETRVTNSLDEQPVWSPDGSKLAFLRKMNDVIELYVVNAEGSGERRISGEGISTSLPSWSPDGSRLPFGTRDLETSNLGIVVVDVGNGDSRTLLEDAYVASPVWSPDGSRIAFVRDDAGRPLPRVSLWVMRPDESDLVELADGLDSVSDVAWQPLRVGDPDLSPGPDALAKANGSIYYHVGGEDGPSWIESIQPDGSRRRVVLEGDPLSFAQVAWSPDGTRIAYRNPLAEDRGIYMANSDGTEAVRLTDGANDGWPTWSPDGTKIAFSSTRHDPNVGACTSTGDTDLGCPTDIYVMDADGSNVTRLTTSSGSEYQPVWSPDGTRIAFTHTLETWSPTAVYVMNADGTDARQVSSHDGGSDFAPSWSPDGSRLVFTGFRYENTGIWIVAADGSNEHPIIGEDWYSVNDPVWSPDGKLIAFVGSPNGGDAALDDELYLMRSDGTGVTQLVDVPGSGVSGEIAWQPIVGPSESLVPTESPSSDVAPLRPRVTATIPVGAFPRAVAVGEGSVWATVDNANGGVDDHLLVRIDPSTNEIVDTIPLAEAGDIAVGAGSLWVASSQGSEGVILRIDPVTNDVVATIPVGSYVSNVGFGFDAVWVTRHSSDDPAAGEVLRIDIATNEVVARIRVGEGDARDVMFGEGSVWVYGHSKLEEHGWVASSLWRIDPVTNEVVATVLDQTGFLGDGGYLPDNVAVGDGWLWAASDRAKGLRIDPTTGMITTFELAEGGFAWPFLVYEGHIFFGLEPVRILDMETLEVVGSIPLESQVADASLDPVTGTLWIASYEGAVTRIDLH